MFLLMPLVDSLELVLQVNVLLFGCDVMFDVKMMSNDAIKSPFFDPTYIRFPRQRQKKAQINTKLLQNNNGC